MLWQRLEMDLADGVLMDSYGSGDGHGACMVHNPGYDFNDNNVAIGSAYWSLLVERFLPA